MGEIKENQKAVLTFKLEDDSEKEVNCRVKTVYRDRISLFFPEEMLVYSQYFEEGEELSVEVFTESGIELFDTIILNSPLEEDFMIEYSENSTNIQRREYARVPFEAKILIQRANRQNVVTYTIDISGGGIRIYSDSSFDQKEDVKFNLFLSSDSPSIQAEATVVQHKNLPKNEYILIFAKIDERVRDRVIKKCFEIQTADLTE